MEPPAPTAITAEELAALDGLDDWRFVLGAIHAEFRAESFGAAASLVSAVAKAADAAGHHPDVDLRYPSIVHVVLTTHATGGVTALDVELAREISSLAAAAGATAAPPRPRPSRSPSTPWTPSASGRSGPRCSATATTGGYLVDPLRIGPPVWFQQMDEPRTDRDRFHIDVSVAHDAAPARLAAALAAGGRLVTDQFARSWWVLADADGNEACICTWQDR